jgi:hypothetical protein
MKPSSVPSEIPSMQPSSQPSAKPSAQPSRFPSRQPSGQPTTVPSSVPTSVPTSVPFTNSPTMTGDTLPPTSIPTSKPTINTQNYLNMQIYRTYKSTYNYLESLRKYRVYAMLGFFYYKKLDPKYCSDWSDFRDKRLITLFDNVKFVSATAYYQYEQFQTGVIANLNTTCSDATVISGVVSSLKANVNFKMTCNGHDWRVASCAQKAIFCIDCIDACGSCPGNSFINNPCRGSCPSQAAMFSVLRFNALEVILFPVVNSVSVIPLIYKSSSDVSVSIVVSGSGLIVCSVYPSNFVVTSIYSLQHGSASVTRELRSLSANVSLNFVGLSFATGKLSKLDIVIISSYFIS